VKDQAGTHYDYELDLSQDTSGARLVALTGWDKRVLDLGCAAGALDRVLIARGCRVVGVEFDRAAAKLAEDVCERVVVGDLDILDLALELEGRRFDVVIAGDVLEHLREPVRLLKALPELLAPGGYLVLSVPNIAHGSVRLALLHGQLPRTDLGLLDRTHVQFLTRTGLLDLLADGGFTAVHLDGTSLPVPLSEVDYPRDDLTARVIDEITSDPLALIYQHVAVAYPDREDAVPPIAALLRNLTVEGPQGGPPELTVLLQRATNSEHEVELLREQAYLGRLAERDATLRHAHEVRQLHADAAVARHASWQRVEELRKQRRRWRKRAQRAEETALQERDALRQQLAGAQQRLTEIEGSRLWALATRYRSFRARATAAGIPR